MTHDFIGTHIISEFYEIQKDLTPHTIPVLTKLIKESCVKNKINVLKEGSSIFSNGGYTLFFLLEESHLSIHTYTEYKAAFVDIFTCGNAEAMNVLNDIETFYAPKNTETKQFRRGKSFHAQ